MDAARTVAHGDGMIAPSMFPARLPRRAALALGLSTLAAPMAGRARAGWPEPVDDRWLRHDAGSGLAVDHGVWSLFLARYVLVPEDGVARVRYGEVDDWTRGGLQAYIETLAATDPAALGRGEQMAYWINLYNALTVDLILRRYPVSSIRDITDGFLSFGPWGMEIVRVDGEDLSLDDIEHGILRAVWRDPRIHYVVNCASIGCPNLAGAPYRGGGMDWMMTRAARLYVNHPRGAHVDPGGRLVVSGLYDWYDDDFGADEAAVVDHIRGYASEPLAGPIAGIDEIGDYAYDWALNDATGMERPGPRSRGSDAYLSRRIEAGRDAVGETEESGRSANRRGGGATDP